MTGDVFIGFQCIPREYVTAHEVKHAAIRARLQCKRAQLHETDTSRLRQACIKTMIRYILELNDASVIDRDQISLHHYICQKKFMFN